MKKDCVTKYLLCVSLALWIVGSCFAATYVAVDIGTFAGGGESFATSINDAGQVAGYGLTTNGGYHTFRYTTSGGVVDIGTLGGSYSFPKAQNAAGDIVGFSKTAGGADHAFLSTTTTNVLTDLGSLGGGESVAFGVNSARHVVGYSKTASGANYAFLWTPENSMTNLGAFAGGKSQAQAINDADEIAGWSAVLASAPDTSPHAFRWTASSGLVDLGTLAGNRSVGYFINSGGAIAGSSSTASVPEALPQAVVWTASDSIQSLGSLGPFSSSVNGMNDAGQIVGTSENSDGYLRPFLWSGSTSMTNLGTLWGTDSQGQAMAVSGTGQVAGFFELSGGSRRAWLWTTNTGMQELPALGIGSRYAVAINAQGWAVGTSGNSTGVPHACLWRPATAVELVHLLIDSVTELNLRVGLQNSLDGKLQAAVHTLDDVNASNHTAAVNSLNNFISAVEAQRGNQITNADADILVAKANEILGLL